MSATGVPGLSHPSPAPGSREHPFRWHFCSLTHSVSPMVIPVSGSLADMLSAVTPHQTSLAHSHLHSCMLVCNTAIAPAPLGAGFWGTPSPAIYNALTCLQCGPRCWGTTAPLMLWEQAAGTLGFAIHRRTPAPSPAVGQGGSGPTQTTVAAWGRTRDPSHDPPAEEATSERGGRGHTPAGAAPREGAWLGRSESQ